MQSEFSKQMNLMMKNERGVTLLMSLMMMMLVSVLGVAAISLSGTDLQTASYEKISAQAFSATESGITQARNDLQIFILSAPQNGQWPATDATAIAGVMGGASSKPYDISVSGETISFSYVITDFGSANDRTVLITSTGTAKNTQQRIETVFRYEPPNQVGSQECYNTQCSSVDQSSGKTVNFTGSSNSSADL